MFDYNVEYRKNILFIRLIGDLNSSNVITLDTELENIINNLGIKCIVFNFEQLKSIDTNSVQILTKWYSLIKRRKGVSYICGVQGKLRINSLLSNMCEISNELSAIRVINWNN